MKYDVYGLGNALVDLQIPVDFEVVARTGNRPGSMDLVDADTRDRILGLVDRARVMLSAGGSVANAMAGLVALGGRPCFTGCIGDDDYGRAYTKSLSDIGVDFRAQRGTGATGTCIVLITPDAQRTFLTHLGCAASLSRDGVSEDAVKSSRYVYLEGYLWDGPTAIEACRHAMALARRHGARVAFTASDACCVERHHADYREIAERHADLFFANAAEAEALTAETGVEAAARSLAACCGLAAVTDGPGGAYVATRDRLIHVPAAPATPVDTTGAGDAFAGGFLHGINHGLDLEASAAQGVKLAARVISRYGARP